MVSFDLSLLDGRPLQPEVVRNNTALVDDVASRCGLTPKYEGLERLQRRYSDSGFTVLAVPCNQFARQEPGTPEEIQEFCSAA